VAGPPSTARAGGPSATGPPANDSIAGPPATDPAGATVNLSGQGTAGPTVAAPTSVSIPAIDVDTRLVRLGRNPDGTVQVPSTFTAAGWYDQGPAPGQVGPAALLGHIDSTAGPAVFYRLGDLHPGDRVLVTSGHEVRTFAVTGSAIFAKTDFPSQAVWGPTPDAELRLITCGGPFNYATHHYVDNIVVFARMVGAPVPTHG
jgi:LPXTG-site transpeptidase (sortase) family protein